MPLRLPTTEVCATQAAGRQRDGMVVAEKPRNGGISHTSPFVTGRPAVPVAVHTILLFPFCPTMSIMHGPGGQCTNPMATPENGRVIKTRSRIDKNAVRLLSPTTTTTPPPRALRLSSPSSSRAFLHVHALLRPLVLRTHSFDAR